MNRLTPLIARSAGLPEPSSRSDWGFDAEEQGAGLGDDLRLMITGWLGGLVVFGTFLA